MNFWTVFSMDLGRQDWTGRHSPHLDLPRRVQDFPRSAAWLQPWSIGSLTGTRGLGGWVSEAKVVVAQALGALAGVLLGRSTSRCCTRAPGPSKVPGNPSMVQSCFLCTVVSKKDHRQTLTMKVNFAHNRTGEVAAFVVELAPRMVALYYAVHIYMHPACTSWRMQEHHPKRDCCVSQSLTEVWRICFPR